MNPTDKVRAALEFYADYERNVDGTENLTSIKQYAPRAREALRELEGHVLVPVGLLTEAASAVLLAREDCRGNQYWYNTYGETLKKLEDAVLIAPYVKEKTK